MFQHTRSVARRALASAALAIGFVAAAPTLAQSPTPPIEVASPGKVLGVAVTFDDSGRPSYAVRRYGQPVIAPSRLGFQRGLGAVLFLADGVQADRQGNDGCQ